MLIPLFRDWLISINVNKGPYATCLNPHILLVKSQRRSYGVHFSQHWKIFNAELDMKKRKRNRRWRVGGFQARNRDYGIAGVFKLGSLLTLNVYPNATARVYYKPVFGGFTKAWDFKSSRRLHQYYFGEIKKTKSGAKNK